MPSGVRVSPYDDVGGVEVFERKGKFDGGIALVGVGGAEIDRVDSNCNGSRVTSALARRIS